MLAAGSDSASNSMEQGCKRAELEDVQTRVEGRGQGALEFGDSVGLRRAGVLYTLPGNTGVFSATELYPHMVTMVNFMCILPPF